MAPEDPDWIDEVFSEDANKEITKAIVQPDKFCQTCCYWLDLISKTNKNQVVYQSEVPTDSCWMKFSFIRKTSLQVQDIWKYEEFPKWLLSPLDQKSLQELVFKAFKNRKRSDCVDRSHWTSRSDRLTEIYFLLIFRRWWQLWMKSTTIKQRYLINLFFPVFCSFAELDE